MQQHRPVLHGRRHLQMTAQGGQVVPVHRPDVGEAEGLEQHAGREKGLEAPFTAHGVQGQFLPDAGDGAQQLEHILAHLPHPAPGQGPAQEQGQCPHIGRDGDLVVIEHHDEPAPHMPGQVQTFKGLARRQGAVTDDGQDMFLAAGQIAGHGHAQGRGNGGGGMPHAEAVIGALAAAREARDPSQGTQGMEPGSASGQQLVGVGLVPHVPDDLVPLHVEGMQQGQGQFHDPQRRRQMPAVLGHHVYDALAQLRGQQRELFVRKIHHLFR